MLTPTLYLLLTTKLIAGQPAYAVTLVKTDYHKRETTVTRLSQYLTDKRNASRALAQAKLQFGVK